MDINHSFWGLDLRPVVHRFYRPVADYVLAGMQITQAFAVRLAILTLATPVFGLFTLVALVDGLVRRDLRRWGGGRESSLDTLTDVLGVEDVRAKGGGIHGAEIDSRQTARIVEVMRLYEVFA